MDFCRVLVTVVPPLYHRILRAEKACGCVLIYGCVDQNQGGCPPQKMHWFPTRTDYSEGFEGVPNFETHVKFNWEGPFSKSHAPTVHLVTISEALHEPSAMQAGILCDLRDFGWSQDVFNGAVCILQNLTSTIFATWRYHSLFDRRWKSPCTTVISGYCW